MPDDPAPRDGRSPAPKQPDSQPDPSADQPAPTPGLAPLPATDPAPAATAPDATSQLAASADEGTAFKAVAVRETLARLGIGTIAAPSVVDAAPDVAAAPAQACTPVDAVGVVTSPQAAAALAGHPIAHPHGATDEPTHLRGPPAPLDTHPSPFATGGSGGAAPGGANGERDSAIHAEDVVLELADGSTAVAADSCDHAAPASASAAARAPPVA